MNLLSTIIIPTIITITIIIGLVEKKEVYNLFCNGTIEGINTMKSMFPTLIAIFVAISMLKNSGLIEFISNKMNSIINLINIPTEVFPLMLIKPITGSGSLAMATELMKEYGVDSRIGIIAGTIMSSSETTFYVIAMYLSAVKIKRSGKVIIPALIADLVMMITAVLIVK